MPDSEPELKNSLIQEIENKQDMDSFVDGFKNFVNNQLDAKMEQLLEQNIQLLKTIIDHLLSNKSSELLYPVMYNLSDADHTEIYKYGIDKLVSKNQFADYVKNESDYFEEDAFKTLHLQIIHSELHNLLLITPNTSKDYTELTEHKNRLAEILEKRKGS